MHWQELNATQEQLFINSVLAPENSDTYHRNGDVEEALEALMDAFPACFNNTLMTKVAGIKVSQRVVRCACISANLLAVANLMEKDC
jgi:hypothetical protein